jgi:hypothetical protein
MDVERGERSSASLITRAKSFRGAHNIPFAVSGVAVVWAELHSQFMVLAIVRQRGFVQSDLISVSHQQCALVNQVRYFLRWSLEKIECLQSRS